jgi:hypothetical protein
MTATTKTKLYPPCLEPPYFAPEGKPWDQETGRPGIEDFADAIQTWSILQNRTDTTIEEAAAVFNVPIEMVRQAVEHHPWMVLEGKDGNVIGHEGD